MFKIRWMPIAGCVALIMFLLLGTAREALASKPDPRDLVLRLEPSKKVFVLYEPVFLTCKLMNPTSSTVTSEIRGLAIMNQNLKVSVQEGDGKPAVYYSGIIADSVGTPHTSHPPGKAMVETVKLFFNDLSRGLAFPRPGAYTIYAKMYLGNFPEPVYIEAEPVRIEVNEPTEIDERVIESLGSKESLIKLLDGGSFGYCKEKVERDCFKELRALVGQFAESAYAPSITYGLTSSVGWSGGGVTADYGLEIEILKDFLGRWPDHPLAPDAIGTLAYAFHQAGKEKEAKDWVDRFERKYPDRRSPRHLIEDRNK